MIYSVIETDTPHAPTGRLIGLKRTPTAAIELAQKRYKKTGLPIFVASRTNLTKPIFELGRKADKTAPAKLSEKASLEAKLVEQLKIIQAKKKGKK